MPRVKIHRRQKEKFINRKNSGEPARKINVVGWVPKVKTRAVKKKVWFVPNVRWLHVVPNPRRVWIPNKPARKSMWLAGCQGSKVGLDID